jgi:hypothetical protein
LIALNPKTEQKEIEQKRNDLVESCKNAQREISTIIMKKREQCKAIENTEGAIKKGQSRETGNIGYTRRRKTKIYNNIITLLSLNIYKHVCDKYKQTNNCVEFASR